MHTKEEILARIVEVLSEDFDVDRNLILPDSQLYTELDIDSIDAIDLLLKLQRITGKRIQPEAFKQTRTVQDLVDTIYVLQDS